MENRIKELEITVADLHKKVDAFRCDLPVIYAHLKVMRSMLYEMQSPKDDLQLVHQRYVKQIKTEIDYSIEILTRMWVFHDIDFFAMEKDEIEKYLHELQEEDPATLGVGYIKN